MENALLVQGQALPVNGQEESLNVEDVPVHGLEKRENCRGCRTCPRTTGVCKCEDLLSAHGQVLYFYGLEQNLNVEDALRAHGQGENGNVEDILTVHGKEESVNTMNVYLVHGQEKSVNVESTDKRRAERRRMSYLSTDMRTRV